MMALPSQECISDHIKYFLQEDTLQMVQGVLYLHTCIYSLYHHSCQGFTELTEFESELQNFTHI